MKKKLIELMKEALKDCKSRATCRGCKGDYEGRWCKKYRKYDTVLVLYDDYLCYCKACGFGYENKDGDT